MPLAMVAPTACGAAPRLRTAVLPAGAVVDRRAVSGATLAVSSGRVIPAAKAPFRTVSFVAAVSGESDVFETRANCTRAAFETAAVATRRTLPPQARVGL